MPDWLDIKWTTLADHYAADTALVVKYRKEIERKYTASGRHYHTLHHLHDLLSLSDQYRDHLQDKDAVDFAIFYHDVIYNVWRKDNEERSASLAVKRLPDLGVPANTVNIVKVLIESTHTHTIPKELAHVADTPFFLDFDMAILGAEWATYCTYTSQVRQEYHIYPDMLYKAGRKKFLQNTLQGPAIFHTTIFRDQYETKARQNMEKELRIFAGS